MCPFGAQSHFYFSPLMTPDKPIELIKATLPQDGDFVADPLVINERSTEYTLWSQNPILIEYYDLRNPKRDASTAGSLPEIRQGGVTTQTQLTHIFALLSFLKPIVNPTYRSSYFHALKTFDKLSPELLPTSPRLQIIRGVLENACLHSSCHAPH